MNYDQQLANLKNILPNAKSVLIVLPTGSNIDRLASGLALYLSLAQSGKQVSIICDDTILVGQSHLFAIDKVRKTLPTANAGDYIITLENVAANGTVPALEKVDYTVEGNNLNLILKVLPGQTFQPANVNSRHTDSGFDVVFIIGSPTLANLGSIYQQNSQVFTSGHLVNIDNEKTNTNFGATNIVEPDASSLSEMITFVMTTLGLSLQEDIATNLITGIFDATANMTTGTLGADTYQAIATSIKAGGKRPGEQSVPSQATSIPINNQPQSVSPVQQASVQPATPFNFNTAPAATFDLSALIPQDDTLKPMQKQETFTVPPVVGGGNIERAPNDAANANVSSQEERPSGEGVISTDGEPDWLTPKIYKGSSIG